MSDADAAAVRAWLDSGTAEIERIASALAGDGEAMASPSLLPGWSRGHVLTHVARNADAIGNLLHWARTGEVTPMYAGAEQRNAAIEEGAARPAAEIAADLVESDRRLGEAIAGLPDPAWDATVRTNSGREIPARDVTWMRVREVWVHAADLGAGTTFGDLPDGVLRRLVSEVAASMSGRPGAPSVVLADTGGPAVWRVGPPGPEGETTRVSGPVHALCAWLIRGARSDELSAGPGELPAPPAWL